MAYGSMVILGPGNSSFAGIRMLSIPVNKYLGPQGTDPVVVNVTGDVMVLDGNCQCGRNGGIPVEARGRILVFEPHPVIGCSPTHKYNLMQEKGVAAWLEISSYAYYISNPLNFFFRNPEQPGPPNNNMLYVSVEAPAHPGVSQLIDYFVQTWETERIVVSIQPDLNDWDAIYHQWYVQIPMRWVPMLVFGSAFMFAAMFLYKHLININDHFVKRFPMKTTRTRRRHLKFIASQLSIVHLILGIELMTTLATGAFIGIGGWQSNGILPHEAALFFVSGLSGWGFACDMLSAILWTNILKEAPGSGQNSWLGIFLEAHPVAKVALCVVPVVLDTAACLCPAIYITPLYIYQVISSLATIMQLVVGVQFLVQALNFQRHARKTVGQEGSLAMDKLLNRLNRWTLYLSLSMIAFVGFVPIGATMFLYTHAGWVIFWCGAATSRGLTSLCRVMLTQPPSSQDTVQVVPSPTIGNIRAMSQ